MAQLQGVCTPQPVSVQPAGAKITRESLREENETEYSETWVKKRYFGKSESRGDICGKCEKGRFRAKADDLKRSKCQPRSSRQYLLKGRFQRSSIQGLNSGGCERPLHKKCSQSMQSVNVADCTHALSEIWVRNWYFCKSKPRSTLQCTESLTKFMAEWLMCRSSGSMLQKGLALKKHQRRRHM